MRVADGRIFEVPGDSVPARAPRLAVGLSVTPPVATPGELVTWRLGVQNLGRSPLSSLIAVNGEGRRLCGAVELAAGATHEATWTAAAETDTDQTVTVGAETARGDRVSGQASAHLTVRARPEARPAPPRERQAERDPRARQRIEPPPPPVESPWHVGAGVVIGEGLALLGAATMLVVDADKHGLHRHLDGLAQTPAKWGWMVLGAVVCAVLLRTLAGLFGDRGAVGVIGSLLAALFVLAVSLDLIRFITADLAFKENHGYGALVALGGGAVAALGGLVRSSAGWPRSRRGSGEREGGRRGPRERRLAPRRASGRQA